MKTALRISAIITAVYAQAVLGQESIDLTAGLVESADAVVVGTLHGVWSYPWIDGWHERGTITVSETLFGDVKRGDELKFGWEHAFRSDCLRPAPVWRLLPTRISSDGDPAPSTAHGPLIFCVVTSPDGRVRSSRC